VGSYCFDIPDVIGCPFVVSPLTIFPFLSFTQKYDENNITVLNPSTPQNFAAVGLIISSTTNYLFLTTTVDICSMCALWFANRDLSLPSDRGAEWNGPQTSAAR
jgi:hypothetical protein